jgi:hypothetical protein
MTITEMFVATIGGKSTATATVYMNGSAYATYSKAIAIEVAKEIGGEAVDDDTGEILQ